MPERSRRSRGNTIHFLVSFAQAIGTIQTTRLSRRLGDCFIHNQQHTQVPCGLELWIIPDRRRIHSEELNDLRQRGTLFASPSRFVEAQGLHCSRGTVRRRLLTTRSSGPGFHFCTLRHQRWRDLKPMARRPNSRFGLPNAPHRIQSLPKPRDGHAERGYPGTID